MADELIVGYPAGLAQASGIQLADRLADNHLGQRRSGRFVGMALGFQMAFGGLRLVNGVAHKCP